MSQHFKNIFSFSGKRESKSHPVVKVKCNDNYDVSDCSLGNPRQVVSTTNDCSNEYDDYEIRITSIPGPQGEKGEPGVVGGPVTQSIIPEDDTINLGSAEKKFGEVNANTIYVGGIPISSAGGKLSLPTGTKVGGVEAGTISIKGSVNTVNNLPKTNVDIGDGYIIRTGEQIGFFYVCTGIPMVGSSNTEPIFTSVGKITGPEGPQGPPGASGPTGPRGVQGQVGPGLFYFEQPANDANVSVEGSNVIKKIAGIGTLSTVYSKQMYASCTLTFPPPKQAVASEMGLVESSTLEKLHRINFISTTQYFINNDTTSYSYTPQDIFTIVVSDSIVQIFQNDKLIKDYYNNSPLQGLKACASLYEVGCTIEDVHFGYVVNGHTGPTGPAGIDGTENIIALQTLTQGMTGNVNALTFSSETIFTKSAEIVGNISSNIIDYTTNGSTVYSTETLAGPYTYDISGVPDLSDNRHVITIMFKATDTNKSSCYASAITVNTEGYTLNWPNGEDPGNLMADVSTNDIVTQQIALLPRNFSNNTAISNLSFYRSV
jgi:hypothetical protein